MLRKQSLSIQQLKKYSWGRWLTDELEGKKYSDGVVTDRKRNFVKAKRNKKKKELQQWRQSWSDMVTEILSNRQMSVHSHNFRWQ